MKSVELRQKFRDFFEKKYNHKWVESSSLIPDDPSVLLTTAGMQQFKKYFTGELRFDSGYQGAASIQKCFRTSDIDEVGDESHNTFFEMLGNFSFGGYFKKEAIEYSHEFLTRELGLKIDFVTVFEGDPSTVSTDAQGGERSRTTSSGQIVPRDTESEKIWQSLGIKNIKSLPRSENFWGPTGSEGPCGPTTEIFVKGLKSEIWNLVFNEYYSKNGTLEPLKIKGVDTGMGLERLATAVQGKKNIYETDLFSAFMEVEPNAPERTQRILADHARAVSFLIADGVRPSNKEAGYILRDLIRRLLVHSSREIIIKLFHVVQQEYGDFYGVLDNPHISTVLNEELDKSERALREGAKKGSKIIAEKKGEPLTAAEAFGISSTLGIRYPIMKDLFKGAMRNVTKFDFEVEEKKHKEISRVGAEKKFGGHGLLLNTGELKAVDERELKIVTRLHTATHLMQAALREVLGPEVKQNGSDITAERTRFDFFFSRKVTVEELKKVEDLVNKKIAQDLPVSFVELPIEEAKKTGALYFFKAKYGDRAKVYYIGKSLDEAFSKEFCGGPHVFHTAEVGKFKILKEESAAAGIRRVRAAVE